MYFTLYRVFSSFHQHNFVSLSLSFCADVTGFVTEKTDGARDTKKKTLIRTVYARNEGVFHLLDCQSLCTSLFCSFGFIYLFLLHCIFHSLFSFLYLFISFYHPFCHFSLSVVFPILLPSFVLHLVPLTLHQFCLLFVILYAMTSYNGSDCSHSEFPTFIYSVNVSR